MVIFHQITKLLTLLCVFTPLILSCAVMPTETSVNPASDRIAAQAGIPNESENPSAVIVPNVKPIVDATTLAAANTEAVNIVTATRLYLIDNPSITSFVSDKLWPGYISANPEAFYQIDPISLRITKVSSINEGWAGIVFSLSHQKWQEGNPDNDHDKDQDIP